MCATNGRKELPRSGDNPPFVWGEDESWKDAYARVDREQAERLRQAGEERRSR